MYKLTFYSIGKEMKHLRYRETVAMNTQHVADLGLKRGDYIFLRSNKGWSGFYEITDSGCAYGTIDVYIDYAYLPSWGAENGVQVLTGPTPTFDTTPAPLEQ